MKFHFDTSNIYYLPQYLPLLKECLNRDIHIKLVCYRNNIKPEFQGIIEDSGVDYCWVENEKSALEFYNQDAPNWILFANEFKYADKLSCGIKTVQLGHGVGPKPSYYHKSSTPMTVRFIEGALRLKKIKELYPDDNFVQVGYSKLDPIINQEEEGIELKNIGLNPEKKTILYAPTFNPSSIERFPDNWPEDFKDKNILIKPHTFTYTIDQYKKQRRKLQKWAGYPNVFVAGEDELSIVPYLKTADILLSEASSTLFEFAALDKPVIVCNFFKLKWSYRGPFHYRFVKRFGKDNVLYKDIGLHVNSYKALKNAVSQQLGHPEQYRQRRFQYTYDHIGLMDGQASRRIVEYLLSYAPS